jgi:hypothetical protein
MPIHHYLVVLLVALAVPLQSALAACRCFQETDTSPVNGYLELVQIPCTSTPSGYGWLKVAPGTHVPSPDLWVALKSSRTFAGCSFINYNGEWPGGGPKVLLDYCVGCGTCNNPPSLVFDFQPPDSQRTSTACSTTAQTTYASGSDVRCTTARIAAIEDGEQKATAQCQAGLCQGSLTSSSCQTLIPRESYKVSGTYTYYCYDTYNLCQ